VAELDRQKSSLDDRVSTTLFDGAITIEVPLPVQIPISPFENLVRG
jgi:hypothetical protein